MMTAAGTGTTIVIMDDMVGGSVTAMRETRAETGMTTGVVGAMVGRIPDRHVPKVLDGTTAESDLAGNVICDIFSSAYAYPLYIPPLSDSPKSQKEENGVPITDDMDDEAKMMALMGFTGFDTTQVKWTWRVTFNNSHKTSMLG